MSGAGGLSTREIDAMVGEIGRRRSLVGH